MQNLGRVDTGSPRTTAMTTTQEPTDKAMQEKIKYSFHTSARTYDQAAILQQQVADNLFDYIIQQQLNPKHILELGAGTGYLSSKIERAFQQSQFTITDCANGMLTLSKAKNSAHHIAAFAESLPFTHQSHDLIISNLMLQWCDFKQTLSEVTRVLTPNGRFIATTLGPKTLHNLNNAWRQLGYHDRINVFMPIDAMQKQLVEAGLIIHSITATPYVVYFDEPLQLLKNLKDIGSVKKNKSTVTSLLTKNHIDRLGVTQAEYEVVLIDAKC